MSDYDVVIAGGGHNCLACGAVLAKAGLKVLVAERNPWVGGGTVTREITEPGFRHDLYGSSHVWIHANEAFNELKPDLEQHGLEYLWSEDHITGHPNRDGPGIVVYKDIDKTVASIAQYSERDAARYREIYDDFELIRDGFVKGMFSPPSPPSYLPAVMENSAEGLKMLRNYSLSARAFTLENFENPQVRAFILGWATAPQVAPDQLGTGQSFYIMIPGIHTYGQAIPKGGSQMLSVSLAGLIESLGGRVMTGASVSKFIVEKGAARGIRLEDGTDILAGKAVITGLDPKQTFLRLIDDGVLDDGFLTMVRNFSFGNVSICRVHYALNEAPQYLNGEDMSKTPFQRVFGTMDDIDKQYIEIAAGVAPSDPFLWVACWTLMDPSRAPEGKHTLIVDTFVPNRLANGDDWDVIKQEYTDNVLLAKLREYTSNMGDGNIIAQYIDTGVSLAEANLSFVDGTTTGGERTLAQMGYFRPFPGYSDYRTPIEGLYMTGPSCHPGGGITAMGTITANEVLIDLGLRKSEFEF